MTKTGKGSARSGTSTSGGGGLPVPIWLPPVLAALATLLLFREFIFSDAMLFGSDTLSLGYVAREFYARAVTEGGVFPRWNPYILGGTPFLEALSGGDALYPTSLLLFIMEPYRALGWKLVLHVFLAGLFAYGWVRSLGRSRAAATVACVAYAVAPFLVSLVQPGHDGKLFVTALTPLMFWAMERTFTRRGLLPYVGVALVVALVILTTHFQLAYFLFGASGLYYLFRVVVDWRRSTAGDATRDDRVGRRPAVTAASRFGLFLVAAVLGASAAGIQLIPAYQYVTEFSRRTATTTAAGPAENLEYASSWSLHPEEVAGLVVPEFTGNNAGGAAWAQDSYWGRNVIRDNHPYAGLVVLILAVVGFLGMPRRGLRWFLAGVGAVAVLYGLGAHTPVWRIFYEVLPGVRLFRAPDMVAFLFGFASITLAAFGVDRLLAVAGVPVASGADPGPRRKGATGSSGTRGAGEDDGGPWGPGPEGDGRVVATLLALTGILALGMLLAASGALTSFWTSVVWSDIPPRSQAILEAHQPFIVRGLFVATILAAAVAGTAWAARRSYLKGTGVAVVLLLLVFIDGFRISTAFIETLDFQAWAAPDPILEHLVEAREAEPLFRVASLARGGQDTRPTMFGLELATGHHPNDLARYRELIGMRGSGMPENLFHPNVQGLVNLRYLVVPGALQQGPPPVLQTQAGGQIHESLYELPTLPRARLVADATVVPEEDAVSTILSDTFDPRTTVLLNEPPPLELGGGPVQGEVEWLERGINRQRLRVVSDRPALLVVADNWFPAWQARVDGEEAPVLRAYHTLRAVPVPEGEHEVEVYYESSTLEASLWVSLGTLLLLLTVAVVDVLRGRRGGREP